MASAFCAAVLFASVVWGIGDSSVTQEHGCNAAKVIEGGTAVMEFFLRQDINMSSDDVFANLRRDSDSDSDIVRCFPHSKTLPVDCTSVNVRYLTDGLADNSMTFSIPNVTREFEDTYTLRVYANDKAEPPISCSLEVISTIHKTTSYTTPRTPQGDAGGTIDDGVLIAAVAGSLGTLFVVLVIITSVCCLRKCRRSKKKRKKDVTSSIETEQTFVLMPVPANKKRSKKAADALLPQTTPSTASDIKVTSPRIEVNHSPEQNEYRRRKDGTSEVESIDNDNYKSTASPPVPEAKRNSWKQKDLACQQSKKAADTLPPQTTPSTASDIKGTSPRIEVNRTPEQDEFKRRKGGTSEVDRTIKDETRSDIDSDNYKSTKSPPALEAKHNVEKQKNLAFEPWYFGNITSEQAAKYMLAAENGDGSFLVMDSNGKLDKYLLKVKCNGQVKNRMICVSQSGFWIESHKHFPTVTSLIDYYREHAGCFPINLSRPCVRTSNIP